MQINPMAAVACLLGRQIGPHDSTIVPQMADKLAELIIHVRHDWSINGLGTTNIGKMKSNVYLYYD